MGFREDVRHYGEIIEDNNIRAENNYIRVTIWKYQDRYFLDTRLNGVCIQFHKL